MHIVTDIKKIYAQAITVIEVAMAINISHK